MKKLLILALLLFLSPLEARIPRGAATAGAPPGLFIPAVNNSSVNWQNAGVPGGIPTRATQCGSTLNPVGGVPSGTSSDDAGHINAAIAACTAGQFILLNSGTATAINIVSFTGNAMTVTSGTGIAIGDVISCAGCQSGTTVTAGSGTSWTVSYPPYVGVTISNVAGTSIIPYSILQSESLALNKGISLRGSGTCNGTSVAPPICPVDINVYDGAIPDWAISSTTGQNNCGVISTAAATCSSQSGVIQVSGNGNFDWGWGGCSTGSGTAPTSCGTFLAADVSQGASTIQVTSTATFVVGAWFLIDELPALGNVTNPAGTTPTTIPATSDFLSSSASPATNRVAAPDSSGGSTWAWSLFPNRVNAELHKITSIGAGPCPGVGCTITFDEPLTVAFRQSGGHNSQVFWPTGCCSATYTPLLSGAGVENLSITRPGSIGVAFLFCTGCWAKNVEVGNWATSGITFQYSSRSEATNSYIHHCSDCENNGQEYSLWIANASTDILVDDNNIMFGGKGMVGRAAGAGSVVAYNYFGPTFYMQASIGDAWVEMTINGSHYAGAHGILFEGNYGNTCDNDNTHGNALYHTYFRNNCSGIRDTFVDPSNGKTVNDSIGQGWGGVTGGNGPGVATPTGLMRAGGAMAYDYWMAFAGNVMGTSGVTTSGNGWSYCINAETGPGATDKGMWALGWVGGGFTATDSNLNCQAATPFAFRNGNYDYVNGAIVDNAAGFSQAFPNSFYLPSSGASKPAFFSAGTCTYPWPWVDVHSSPFIFSNTGGAGCGGSGLPARARYLGGKPMVAP